MADGYKHGEEHAADCARLLAPITDTEQARRKIRCDCGLIELHLGGICKQRSGSARNETLSINSAQGPRLWLTVTLESGPSLGAIHLERVPSA